MREFLRRPQNVRIGRLLFQVHLWLGIAAALYVLVVTITGAVLVFRIDLQRALSPHLFSPTTAGPSADLTKVLATLQRAYPNHRVSGIDAPTTSRPVVLAYVTQGRQFVSVLVDPVDAHVLGVLPERSFVRILQDLHFDLLSGRTGRILNGIGAFCLLAMGATGLVIWWPGLSTWTRALKVDFGRGWKRVAFDLHSATGIWAVALIAMWALTGIYFAFPRQFRSVVSSVSPLSDVRQPSSDVAARERQPRPDWSALIEEAQRQMPGRPVARVVTPATDQAAFQVLFADRAPTPAGAELQTVYLDQYTGAMLQQPARGPRGAGDLIMAWVAPLHVGSFGGPVVKVVWLVFGLAPTVLIVTGMLMWWNRVLRGQTRGSLRVEANTAGKSRRTVVSS